MVKLKLPHCIKHNRTALYPNPEWECPQCNQEMWEARAKFEVKGLKCPICCGETKLSEYDINYIAFECPPKFDEKGNYQKGYPHGAFRVKVCEECFSRDCKCYHGEEY